MSHTNGNGHTKLLYNNDAEQAALGSLLINSDAMLDMNVFLRPDDFRNERHRWIYEAIQFLYEQRRPFDDLVVLTNELHRRGKLEDIGGESYLTQLMNITPNSIHAEWYGRIVEKDAIRRRLLDAAGSIAKLAHNLEIDNPDELLGQAETYLLDVLDNRQENGIKSAMEVVEEVTAHIERVHQAGGITGLPTGLSDLDALLGGLQRSDMIVIAGRPGMGKTSLATQFGKRLAKEHKKRCLIFSLEMSRQQLMHRMIASESGIDASRLRAGRIQDNEWSNYHRAQRVLSEIPFYIDDSSILTPATMRSKALRHHARHGLDLIIVDYLQLMDSDRRGQNRNQEVSDISRACKVLARELNIPVIALSQLSRQVESRHDKRPRLSDLRESGAIEQDADVVLFLYLDEVYNPDTEFPNVAEIILAKHRSGPTGQFSVYFKKHLTEFADLQVRSYNLQQID